MKAHRRLIQRKKYRRHCTCNSSPIIITATKIAKIVPKSRFGNTVWAHCLAQKYWHGQPLCRVIQALEAQKTPFSISTIVGGFMKLRPLLKKVYEAMIEKSLTDSHWHADKTGWKVFESLKGKANHRWFLWVFKSKSAAIFILNPSRSTQVVKGFFRKTQEESSLATATPPTFALPVSQTTHLASPTVGPMLEETSCP